MSAHQRTADSRRGLLTRRQVSTIERVEGRSLVIVPSEEHLGFAGTGWDP